MRDKKLLYDISTGVEILVASNSLELAHFNFFIPIYISVLMVSISSVSWWFLMVMRTGEHWAKIALPIFFPVKTCSNGCSIKEYMLTDRVFINLIT